jgi:membrane fusion protein, heavy metal efflux system
MKTEHHHHHSYQYATETFCAFVFAVCVLVALLLLTGCERKAEPPPEAKPVVQGSSVKFAEDSPAAQRIAVERVASPVESELVLPGRLTWNEEATTRVFPPFAGRVTRILVRPGDAVRAGQPLAEMASPDFGQAQADARKASADLAFAAKALDRARDLNAHGVLAAKDVQQAEADHAKAQAEADRAMGRLTVYGQSAGPGTFSLRSPVAGTAVERNINPGQEVRPDQPGAPLFVVTDPKRLWIVLDASEAQLAWLKPGLPLVITSNQFPDDAFAGELEQVSDFIDPTSRTLKVRGSVPNTQRQLKAEMFVNARLRLPKAEAPTVSARAVYLSGNRQFVFVRTGAATFTRRGVRTGPEMDGRLPVLAGLHEGDEVVVGGNLFLDQILAAARPEGLAGAQTAKVP